MEDAFFSGADSFGTTAGSGSGSGFFVRVFLEGGGIGFGSTEGRKSNCVVIKILQLEKNFFLETVSNVLKGLLHLRGERSKLFEQFNILRVFGKKGRSLKRTFRVDVFVEGELAVMAAALNLFNALFEFCDGHFEDQPASRAAVAPEVSKPELS
jgi:hypothetical protein